MENKKSNKNSGYQEMKNAFKEMPTILQVIIVVILLILIFKIVNWIVVKVKTISLTNKLSAEQGAFENAGQKLTYMPSQYNSFADQIEQAMQYTGTYTDVIENIFKQMQNDLDILELNKAWGKRDIYFWGFAYNFTLAEALTDEMDVTEINNILKSKNITYRY